MREKTPLSPAGNSILVEARGKRGYPIFGSQLVGMEAVGRGVKGTLWNEPRHRAPVLQFSASRRRSRVVAVVVFVCHVKNKREGEGTRTNVYACGSSGVYTHTDIRWCRQGIVRLVSDGFSLVRCVGEPAGLWANGAHAPHEGERFKRDESSSLSLSFSPSFPPCGVENPSAARTPPSWRKTRA